MDYVDGEELSINHPGSLLIKSPESFASGSLENVGRLLLQIFESERIKAKKPSILGGTESESTVWKSLHWNIEVYSMAVMISAAHLRIRS